MVEVKKFMTRKRLPAFFAGLSILFLMLLLSACGYNGTTTGSQPSTPSPSPSTPTPTPPLRPEQAERIKEVLREKGLLDIS